LSVGDPVEWEEAILEVTRQKRAVLQVRDRLSLGVQNPLYALDDLIAMGEEELEEFDMCLEWHLGRTRSSRRPFFRRKQRVKSHATKRVSSILCSLCPRATASARLVTYATLRRWLHPTLMLPIDIGKP
jgi:hypothetical protein